MNEKKRIIKILIIGVFLILILIANLDYTGNLFGNPIQTMVVNKDIKEYLLQYYKDLDLEIVKTEYSFKESGYSSLVKSKTSIDTHFHIYHKDGKVQRDEYISSVLHKKNTLKRLEEEYTKKAKLIISKVEGLGYNKSLVQILDSQREKMSVAIELDTVFDQSQSENMGIHIRTDIEDISLKNVAEVMAKAHKQLTENGYYFREYSISTEVDAIGNQKGGSTVESKEIRIYNITPEDIESEDLEKRLER